MEHQWRRKSLYLVLWKSNEEAWRHELHPAPELLTITEADCIQNCQPCADAPNGDEVGEDGDGPGQVVGEGPEDREHLVKWEAGGAHHGDAAAHQEDAWQESVAPKYDTQYYSQPYPSIRKCEG